MANELEIRIIAKDGATQIIRGVTTSLDGLGASAQRNGILLANATGKEIAFKDLSNNAKSVVKDLDNVGAATKRTNEQISLSKQQFGQLAAAGVAAFSLLDRAIGNTDNQVAKLASGAMQIALGFAAGGPIGAAIAGLGVGVGLLIEHLNAAEAAAQKARAEMVAPFEDARKAIDALNPPVDELVASLEKTLGVSRQTAENMADAARQSETYRESLRATMDLQQAAIEKQNELNRVMSQPPRGGGRAGGPDPAQVAAYRERVQELAAAQEELAIKSEHAATAAIIHANAEQQRAVAMQYALFAAQQTAAAMGDTRREAIEAAQGISQYELAQIQADNVMRKFADGTIGLGTALTALGNIVGLTAQQVDAYRQKLMEASVASRALSDASNMAGMRFTDESRAADANAVKVAQWNTQMERLHEKQVQAQADAAKAVAANEKLRASYQQLVNALRNIVASVMQPTSVTDEDMQAAAMGKYVDKWDEWRRRLEAAMTGTNVAAQSWGAKFSAQLAEVQQRTGMSLEQIDKAFKNFSLFADKRNLKLINWDVVVGDTQDAINAIIGKYNVVTAGVEAYLASDAAKEQLPQLKLALGLDVSASEQDVKDALTGALGGISGTGEKATVKTSLTLDTTGAKGQANEAQKLIASIPASTAGSTVITRVNLDAATALGAAGNLKDAIGKIPATEKGTTVTTIVDVVKASTFDENLKAILDDIAKIPTEIDVTVKINGGGTNGSGANSSGTTNNASSATSGTTNTATSSNTERVRITQRESYGASALRPGGFRLAGSDKPDSAFASGAPGSALVSMPVRNTPRRSRNTPTPSSTIGANSGGGGDIIFDFRGAQFYGSGHEVTGLLERTLTGTFQRVLDQSAVSAADLAQLLGQ